MFFSSNFRIDFVPLHALYKYIYCIFIIMIVVVHTKWLCTQIYMAMFTSTLIHTHTYQGLKKLHENLINLNLYSDTDIN